jgi:hypothetical protein
MPASPRSSSARDARLVRPAELVGGYEVERDARVARELHPRVHVGRELAVAHHDALAGAQRQDVRRQVDAVARVGKQRDLVRIGADQARGGLAGAGEGGLEVVAGQVVRGRAAAVERLDGADGALRKGRYRGGVEVRRAGGGGEFPLAEGAYVQRRCGGLRRCGQRVGLLRGVRRKR